MENYIKIIKFVILKIWGSKMDELQVTAVVPAYNEENTIGNVLNALKSCNLINEIIVINDGSTDRTAEIVKQHNIRIVNINNNIGKGQAIKRVCSNLKTDILFLCDADLIGFKQYHIKKILEPILEGKAIMSIGLRDYGKLQNFLVYMKIFPLISGERAIVYPVFKEILKSKYFYGYGMEAVMNHYCKKNKLPAESRVLSYNQIWKTKKFKRGGIMALIKQSLHIWYVCFMLKVKSKSKYLNYSGEHK